MKIHSQALTFDDVLLRPRMSSVLPAQVKLHSRLTRTLKLNMPLVSAAMDTVTGATMAIAMAEQGGIGIIHRNLSIAEQVHAVRRVKRWESGIVRNPTTIEASQTLADLRALCAEHGISTVPVVEPAKAGGAEPQKQLVGIVTKRDYRNYGAEHGDTLVRELMTPKDKLITVSTVDLDKARQLMQNHKIEQVPIVRKDRLTGWSPLRTCRKPSATRMPLATARGSCWSAPLSAPPPQTASASTPARGGRRCAGAGQRARPLANRARHHSWHQKRHSNLPLIGGNVATGEGAKALIDVGADAVKVGIGPGSICTTRIVTGVGVPQITAISEVAEQCAKSDVPLIADGGLRYSGDIAKALAAGASSVMIGSLLAGTDESPGQIEMYQGRSYKSYRGMGSLGAMGDSEGARERYFQNHPEDEGQMVDGLESNSTKLVPEGIEGRVPYKGSVATVLNQLIGGLRQAMGYLGLRICRPCASAPSLCRSPRRGAAKAMCTTSPSPKRRRITG